MDRIAIYPSESADSIGPEGGGQGRWARGPPPGCKESRAMIHPELKALRDQIDVANAEMLALMNRRLRLVEQVKEVKTRTGISMFSPRRESEMFNKLLLKNEGPMTADLVRHFFKEIFKLSLDHMEADVRRRLEVHRMPGEPDKVVRVGAHAIGGGPAQLVAGPSAIESADQFGAVAAQLAGQGVRFLRADAYKPRTSPYNFQGLGLDGLRIARDIADRHDQLLVTEILDTRTVEDAEQFCDVFRVGTRNMHNYELLRLLGQTDKPVWLERGWMATIEEFIYAAEYIAKEGNSQIVLCERGVRTHERWTTHTLDLSAIPLLKQETSLPVAVDVGHGTGRKDIMATMARAALAAGADAVTLLAHPAPPLAMTDNALQMDLDEFGAFHAAVFP